MRGVVLMGLPATGKSAVGRTVAAALGMAFHDTDEIIESREERSIAEIFREQGEAYFRGLEDEVVQEVALQGGVIATGGGAVTRDHNLRRLREAGWLVALVADLDVIAARLGSGAGWPLLEGNVRANLERLWAARRERYLAADLVLDVGDLSVEQAAQRIVAFLGERERLAIPLAFGNARYRVYIGDQVLGLVGEDLRGLGVGSRAAIITTARWEALYGERLRESLRLAGIRPVTLEVPAGEASKTLETAARLYSRMRQEELDRRAAVLALGGEEIGDLAGFVAATYLRGVPLAHLPTTLIAQVDSSIGGKVALNHGRLKNLVGTLYHPRLVVSDVSALAHGGPRALRAGLAEAVKYGMVSDAGLLAFLEEHLDALLGLQTEPLVELVRRCVLAKARLVEQDELGEGPRELLNYGHTFAHALEAATDFHRYLHGEAVAIGMSLAARVARAIDLADEALVARQDRLLRRAGLPTGFSGVSAQRVLDALLLDKKRRDGTVRLVLPVGPGRAVVREDVARDVLEQVLSGGRPAAD